MIRRRAVIGLLLLCALVFCAFGASSASAAKGTTAFECVKGVGGEFKYSDADCDQTNASGEFGHVAIPEKKVMEGVGKLVSANYKLNTTLLTLAVEVTCTSVVTGISSFENLPGPPMRAVGALETSYSTCTVNKPAKCVVKTPITVNAKGSTLVISEAPEAMGVLLEPAEGNFTELIFQNKSEGEKCGIANGGKPYPVKGSIISTGMSANMTGAIQRFKAAEASMQKLTIGGEPATLEGETTVSLKGGAAISMTTTAT